VSVSPTVYGLDNCDSCRKARNWLKRAGVEHEFVDYREQRIEPATLKAWAQQLGGWDALVNKASTTWRNLPPMRKTPGSDPEWTLLIKEHPAVVKRPVVAMPDGRVHQGFTQGNFEKLFGTKAK
jgi:Spx/MgsR family transcriptional regulator